MELLIMIHVMCDLETLGRRAGCKILSIGAVVFGPSGLGAEFYLTVDRNLQGYLHEDPQTVDWWAAQTDAAKRDLFGHDPSRPSLWKALDNFNKWLIQVGGLDSGGRADACVWGNGADFDNAILTAGFAATELEQAWPFWSNRCYRTLKSLAPSVKLVRAGTHHNALDDAKTQAEHAVRLMDHLKAW
jgi:hypothetical protein